jgi:hypothetical protein
VLAARRKVPSLRGRHRLATRRAPLPEERAHVAIVAATSRMGKATVRRGMVPWRMERASRAKGIRASPSGCDSACIGRASATSAGSSLGADKEHSATSAICASGPLWFPPRGCQAAAIGRSPPRGRGCARPPAPAPHMTAGKPFLTEVFVVRLTPRRGPEATSTASR